MLDSVTYEVCSVSSPTTFKTLGFIVVSYDEYKEWLKQGHWDDMMKLARLKARETWRIEDYPSLMVHSIARLEKR